MRYLSEDGEVFNTAQECCEHEQYINSRLEEEQFEMERKRLLKEIQELYDALDQKLTEYENKCRIPRRVTFVPFYEIAQMLGRQGVQKLDAFNEALEIAEEYYDKDTFHHAIRVAINVANSNLVPAESLEDCLALALLHDLLEDTDFNIGDCNWPDELKICLYLLTKSKKDTYEQYISKIKSNYHNYPEAYWVKIADIKDHLAQTGTLTNKLKEKYLKALPYLL